MIWLESRECVICEKTISTCWFQSHSRLINHNDRTYVILVWIDKNCYHVWPSRWNASDFDPSLMKAIYGCCCMMTRILQLNSMRESRKEMIGEDVSEIWEQSAVFALCLWLRSKTQTCGESNVDGNWNNRKIWLCNHIYIHISHFSPFYHYCTNF